MYRNSIFIFACLFLFACRSVKETGSRELPAMTDKKHFTEVLQAELPFQTLSANLNLALQNDGKTSSMTVDAQLKIVRNEALQLSIRMPIIGTEVFRLVMTPNNLLIIDRLNKQYLNETMSDFQAQLPFVFNYSMMEALWTNRLFVAGKPQVSASDLSDFEVDTDLYSVRFSHRDSGDNRYTFSCDHTFRIQSVQIEHPKQVGSLQCNYSDFSEIAKNQRFPMKMQLKIQLNNKNQGLLSTYKSVNTGANIQIDQSIPNKYNKTSLQEMIHLIQTVL